MSNDRALPWDPLRDYTIDKHPLFEHIEIIRQGDTTILFDAGTFTLVENALFDDPGDGRQVKLIVTAFRR